MPATATKTIKLRPAHRRCHQLFKQYGDMTDAEALEAARAEQWGISPSGLRSRRSELCPPRGAGIKDTGRRRNKATVWGVDPEVTEIQVGLEGADE